MMRKILLYLLAVLTLNSCAYKEKDDFYGKDVFHDIDARKAIAHSINKEELNNEINKRITGNLFLKTDSIFKSTEPITDNTYNQDMAFYYWNKIKERYNFDNIILEAYTFNYVIEINTDLDHLGIK